MNALRGQVTSVGSSQRCPGVPHSRSYREPRTSSTLQQSPATVRRTVGRAVFLYIGAHVGNVQPYGSGEDTEAAALARSRPDHAPGYVNELAATMTIGQIATQTVDAVRALNQLTAGTGELAGPGEAREVVGRLALMGRQLPQAVRAARPVPGHPA